MTKIKHNTGAATIGLLLVQVAVGLAFVSVAPVLVTTIEPRKYREGIELLQGAIVSFNSNSGTGPNNSENEKSNPDLSGDDQKPRKDVDSIRHLIFQHKTTQKGQLPSEIELRNRIKSQGVAGIYYNFDKDIEYVSARSNKNDVVAHKHDKIIIVTGAKCDGSGYAVSSTSRRYAAILYSVYKDGVYKNFCLYI